MGGTYDATGSDKFEAIHVEDGGHCAVRGVSVKASVNEAWKSSVTIRGGTRHELAFSTIDGGDKAGRCAWTIATNAALVHDNVIQRCVGHALDFDAYTSASAAWNNLVQNNNVGNEYGQGIFVEETASGNFIFNNTVRNNKNGIELYSLDVGPVTGNIIANNVLEKNERSGISSGGGTEEGDRHAQNNIIVGNTASGNGEADFFVQHGSDGSVVGDYWVGNTGGAGDEVVYEGRFDGSDPANSTNVAIFQP